MRKFFSFSAGIICGLVVGATATILFAPLSGKELQRKLIDRIEEAKTEAKAEMEKSRQELKAEYERMKQGS